MQPNYNEIAQKQQQEYQKSRDPFKYGQQVAQRRYSEIISGLQNQNQAMQKSYSDIYQQTKQQAVKGLAAGGPSLSGGMGQQQKDYVSALEMQQLGQIGSAREQAARDLATQAQSAFANAELEGQQATQMELQNQQAQLGLVQQKQQILNDANLNEEQKRAQLEALGVDTSKMDLKAGNTGLIAGWEKVLSGEASFSEAAGTFLTTALAIGATFVAIKYGGALLKGGFGGLAGKLGFVKKPLEEAAGTVAKTTTTQNVAPMLEFFFNPAFNAGGGSGRSTFPTTPLNP